MRYLTVMTRCSCAWLQRAKLNAQKQREYRERKKAREGEAYLIRERDRQRKYYGLSTQRQRYQKALKIGRPEIKTESPVTGTR